MIPTMEYLREAENEINDIEKEFPNYKERRKAIIEFLADWLCEADKWKKEAKKRITNYKR